MRPFWRDHPIRVRVLALALALGAVLLVSSALPGALRSTEETVGDLVWRLGATAAPERRLVVVDIDEASLRQEGPWPWPRSTLTRLSERLQAAGAAVQAFDMVFPEGKAGDDLLVAQWLRSPVVLGQIFSLDPTVTPSVGEAAGATGAISGISANGPAGASPPGACPAGTALSYGVVGNASSLLTAASFTGHMTPRVEADGVVRKLPALICHGGRLYPALALAALGRAAGSSSRDAVGATLAPTQPAWQLQRGGDTVGSPFGWLAPAAWWTSPALPGLAVPVDVRGDMRVPYRMQREAMVSVSAAEILSGKVDDRLLRGAVALIGATAFGMGDAVATPLHAVAAGVEVHAQSIVGLLDNQVPYSPRALPALQAVALLVMAALLLALACWPKAPAIKSLPLAGLALASLSVLGSGLALLQGNLWLPWAEVTLFALAGATALAAAEHALTGAQRERLAAHLQAYLPAPVARRLAASDPTGTLDAVRREVSVLAANIRNFAAFAAHRPPEETAAVLHAHCCAAVEVVERHGGIVENISGDAILAVWNADGDCPDHAQRAMRAGQDLLISTKELFAPQDWLPESSAVQPLALGIGIESGTALVGSFGPARRRAHAALGEPVTVAARLQSMTQDLSVPILIGPRMASLLPADATVAQGDYLLEGLSRHCALFAPTAWPDWIPPETVWPRDAVRRDDDSALSVSPPPLPGAVALTARQALRDA